MTSRERMLTAMRCGIPDRVPVVVRGVPVWDEDWVRTRHRSYDPLIEATAQLADWEANWGAGAFLQTAHPVHRTVEVQEEDEWTIQTTRIQTPGGDLVTKRRISKRGLPGLCVEFPVKHPEHVDWVMDIPYDPVRPQLDGLRQLQRKVGERGVVIVTLSDPIAHVHGLLGSELLAIWSMERPDLMHRMVEEFTRRVADTLEYLVEERAAEVYGFYGSEYLSPPLASPQQFRRWVGEPLRQFGQIIHSAGAVFWVHCHGPLRRSLDCFAEAAVDCLHPIEAPPMGDVTLAEAKERLGGRICLEGNVQIGDLYAADEDAVRALVRTAIEQAAPGGGFILCPTASPHTERLTPQTVRNYLAYIEEGVKLGAY